MLRGGVRSYNKEMPEEQNRILTDHLSSLLFCPTDTAVMNLKKEGIWKGVYQIGDVMYDAVKGYAKQLENYSFEYFFSHLQGIFNNKISRIQSWYLATIHRVENTNNIEKFGEILEAFELLDSKVIFPVHPRINTLIKRFLTTKAYSNIIFLKPLGYLDMLYFTKHAVKVITDSGGLQKEAYLLGTNVVTVRGETEWIETLADNHNVLAKASKDDILKKVLSLSLSDSTRKNVFGDGNAAKKICSILAELT